MIERSSGSDLQRRDPDGVYPPRLCRWAWLAVVVIVTEIALLLILLGRGAWPGWTWFAYSTLYAQMLGLGCTAAVCLTRAWLLRLPARGAWLVAWALMVLLAWPLAYAMAVIGTVLGAGPGASAAGEFIIVSVIAVGLVGAALLRYLYVHAQWRGEVMAQADARVQALQARIRPHFLFNCLNTIASLIPVDARAAERATEDLADLFRGSMRRADRPIPLSDELDLARKFLDMEQRRLGDRLVVEWSVDELPRDAMVMPLVLQPLLENAIIHGIQPNPKPGVVSVYGRTSGGDVMMTIRNTLAPATEDSADTRGTGMALGNVRERLKLAFDDRASLLTRCEEDMFYAVLSFPHVESPDR